MEYKCSGGVQTPSGVPPLVFAFIFSNFYSKNMWDIFLETLSQNWLRKEKIVPISYIEKILRWFEFLKTCKFWYIYSILRFSKSPFVTNCLWGSMKSEKCALVDVWIHKIMLKHHMMLPFTLGDRCDSNKAPKNTC